jgi:beta-glucosidase
MQSGAAGLAGAMLGAGAAPADPVRFPPGFLWGTATSAYQVDGRGDRRADSIWDIFCRLPGTIHDRSNGDIACDHYHRYPEDLALIARAGLKAYRFSVSWPRVLPEGTGQPDANGLDFYSRLADATLRAGIEPWVCLYHWDLPQALQDRGGWGERAIADWFADYALLMARHLGDRVHRWIMLNEPSVVAVMGHGLGEHAPGLRSRDTMFAAMHHQNLAQGKGIAALRGLGGARFQLGTVLSLQPVHPSSPSDADRIAAAMWDALWNRGFLDPLFHGSYPPQLRPDLEKLARPGDLEQIRQPIDFLGVNYYSPMFQRADPAGIVGTNWGALPPGTPKTAMGWPVDPQALFGLLVELRDRYGNPALYVTENGACFADRRGPDGHIDDPQRIAYLREHIQACRRAIAQRVDLRGYFAWTLLDNFEWAYGYTAPFGLIAVDRTTMQRAPKASYDWFAGVARSGAL